MDISAFNTYLLSQNQVITNVLQYIKEFNKIGKEYMDLAFAKCFVRFINRNECIIPDLFLKRMKVLDSENDVLSLSDTIELIIEYNFIEHLHYEINVINIKYIDYVFDMIEYRFHPSAFKTCLERSEKSKAYFAYYTLLEQIVRHFHIYQLLLLLKN